MQYLSSSIIFCRPRTWPSIRRNRWRYRSLSCVYPCMPPNIPYPRRVSSRVGGGAPDPDREARFPGQGLRVSFLR